MAQVKVHKEEPQIVGWGTSNGKFKARFAVLQVIKSFSLQEIGHGFKIALGKRKVGFIEKAGGRLLFRHPYRANGNGLWEVCATVAELVGLVQKTYCS